jgi:hypothetical protein
MPLSANTLDNILPKGIEVDLLKIDVEGADYLVLCGAKSMFADAPPRIVVIEVSSYQKEIAEFLLSYGYRLYSFDESRSAFIEVERPVFNTYAVREVTQHEFLNFRFIPLTNWSLAQQQALALP